MRKATLEALLSGQFVCPVVAPVEFEDLCDESTQSAVNNWLEPLGMRLARIGTEGAFFMAPDVIGQEEVKRVRKEMQEYRDIYGPAIMAIALIRQCEADHLTLMTGEYIQAGAIETAINANPALESQLNGLGQVIRRFALKNSIRDRVDAVLMHLAEEGFLKLIDRDRSTYRVTGRIEQLWAVIEFIAENEPVAPAQSAELDQEDLNLDGLASGHGDDA